MKIKINSQIIILYLFFFSLNYETLNTFGLGIDFLVTKITVSLLILFSLLNFKSSFSLHEYSKYLYPICIYFVLQVIISFLNRTSSFNHFFNVAQFLDLLILIILANYVSFEPDILLKGLFVFSLSTILISILYFIEPETQRMTAGKFIMIRSNIFGGNSNDIGIKLCMSLFILISLIFENKLVMGKNRYLLLIFFPFLLKFLIDTGSRVAFIAFILGISVMFVIFIKRLGLNKKLNLLILGSFLALCAYLFFLKNDTIIKRLHDAFYKGDLSDRGQIWSHVVHIISRNLFFGVGETGLAQRMAGVSPHNVFLEVLACTGIVGFLIFFIFFCRILFAAFRKYRFNNELLPLVLFIPVLGAVLSGQIFEEKIYWVIFAFIISNSKKISKTEDGIDNFSY